MKNTKKLLISIITVVLSLVILIGCVFTASAETYVPNLSDGAKSVYEAQGYGSFEKGLLPPDGMTRAQYKWYHPSVQYKDPTIDGHPNLDFSKGYEYWYDNADLIKMNTDSDGNTFATIIGEKEYSGLFSVKFTLSKVKQGDTISLLYKWRAPSHQRAIEGYIDQVYHINDESQGLEQIGLANSVGGRSQVNIWLADEEDDKEWNISLAPVYLPAEGPTGSVPITYYSVGIQTMLNVDFFRNTDFDDLQIVFYDEQTGIVKDFDGNTLYNTNDLPKRIIVDYDFKDLGETDPKADLKVNIDDILSGKVELDVGPSDTNDSNSGIALWVWIVIAAGVVLVLAVAVVVVIVISKKKKAASTSTEEVEIATEELKNEEPTAEETQSEE